MATHVKFDVNVETWVTREADPEDRWDNGSSDGTVTIDGAEKVAEDGYDVLSFDGDVAIGTTIYVIWAQYGTGDSFGSYGGHYELLDIALTSDYAEIRKEHFEKVTDYSVPWNGYFEWLDGVYVTKLTLK